MPEQYNATNPDDENHAEKQLLLNDAESMFNLVKKMVGVLTGFTIIAVAMSFGIYFVQQDDVIRVFISSTMGWAGYLFAHYAASGKFIHQKRQQHVVPNDKWKLVGGIYGILLIAAGITIWAIALSHEDIITMILGAFAGLLGYLITHYEFTGDML